MKTLSASQITRFDHSAGGCARRWGYEYLDLLKPAPHPSAALGTAVHAELEAWLKNGTAPTSAIALAGIPHAPPPGVAEVEREIALETPNSTWRGFVDALYGLTCTIATSRSALYKFTRPFDGEKLVIHDWKTSSDPKRYGKSADDLASDAQANLYAAWAFSQGAQHVQGRWVYLATKGVAVADPRHVIFERARVEDVVGQLDETARVVQKLYQIRPKSSELPANRDACRSFGGCPHAAYCPPAEVSELFRMDGEGSMNTFAAFLSDIDAKVGGAPVPPVPVVTPPVAVVAPAAPVPPPPPVVTRPAYWMPGDPMNSTQEYLSGVKAPLSVVANAADVPPPAEVAQAYGAPPAPVDRPVVEHGFINSPEGPTVPVASPEEQVVPPPPVAQPAPVVGDDLPNDRDALKTIAISLGVSTTSDRSGVETLKQKIRTVRAAFVPPVVAPPPPVAQPEPVVEAPAPVAPVQLPPVPTPMPVAVHEVAPKHEPLTVETLGFRLFVNCLPMGVEYTSFADVLRVVMPKVRELGGVQDYRQIDFGKGAGLLANTVRTYLLGATFEGHQNLVVDARTPEGRDCIGVLEELSREVVRGF